MVVRVCFIDGLIVIMLWFVKRYVFLLLIVLIIYFFIFLDVGGENFVIGIEFFILFVRVVFVYFIGLFKIVK